MDPSMADRQEALPSGRGATSVDGLPAHLTCDVAIVGYGPVSMILAGLLAEQGVSVIVVERFPERYKLPRAGHFDGESMRTFQGMGFADSIELIARPIPRMYNLTGNMELLSTTSVVGVGNSGWKDSYLTYQPEFEDIFDEHARKLGVRVFMNTTAVGVTQTADGAELSVRTTDKVDSQATAIQAAYIVGADGAGSFVRDALAIKRTDLGFKANDELVIDFEHSDPDREIPQLQEVYQVLDPYGPQQAGRWSGGNWSRLEVNALEGETREHLESEATAWKHLGRWGIHPGEGKIIRHAVYTFESRVCEKWRDGRIFLAGDAAHTSPPFLGQGLCSGIRDALNLSWKLAAVFAGKAGGELLDTYESERSPHVQAIIKMASDNGRMVLMTDPEQARLRDDALRANSGPPPQGFPRLGPGVVRSTESSDSHDTDGRPSLQARVAVGKRVDRLDQFLRRGWKVISRHAVSQSIFSVSQSHLISRLGIEFAHVSRGSTAQYIDLDGEYDSWYLDTGRRAFLLRPDNYVFGSVKTISELPSLLDDLSAVLKTLESN